jgi:phosphatidate phosphatase PAH1
MKVRFSDLRVDESFETEDDAHNKKWRKVDNTHAVRVQEPFDPFDPIYFEQHNQVIPQSFTLRRELK